MENDIENKITKDKIQENNISSINISETLERDIKIIIKYILFQKDLQKAINF